MVRALVHRLTAHLFGAHIPRVPQAECRPLSASGRSICIVRFEYLCDAEIDSFTCSVAMRDVGWF